MESTVQQTYGSPDEAKAATSEFYQLEGFAYDDATVDTWLDVYFPSQSLPVAGRVLDLCCGDGVWAAGMARRNPELELHGIDIAGGGIEKARSILPDHCDQFVTGDAEEMEWPWSNEYFTLIFARGPGLFNQHSMDRPATIAVLEAWHRLLAPECEFVSMFYSNPELFGTYTNPLKVSLPYNRSPRLTEAVDFTGGKFHHDKDSFCVPFEKSNVIKIVDYRFERNNHILTTRHIPE